MGVTVRQYSRGWQVDVMTRLPNGSKYRERRRLRITSKSAAMRWGQDRERHLLQHGPPTTTKEVPTVEQFAPRFLNGHARANRQKPSGIASKEMILRVHLIPALGQTRLDGVSDEDVQHLKTRLESKAPKTVNNVLNVLSVLLKKAVAWRVIERMPCSIELLKTSKSLAAFYDFDEYERLVAVAREIDHRTYLAVLLGAEGGLRCGEMIALEWADVDLVRKKLCVKRSDWNGQIGTPKGGRHRFVPLTLRLEAALRQHRHLRSSRVLCQDDGGPLTRQMIQNRMKLAARRSGCGAAGVHILRHTFCSHLAMRGAASVAIQELAGHKQLSMTERYMHLTHASAEGAIRLLDPPSTSATLGNMVATTGGASVKC